MLSTNKVLTFAANATVSTGTVTITAVDNKVHTPVDTPDKTVKVSGELSSGARPTAPVDVTLTIEDDDDAPVLSLKVDPDEIDEDGGESTITVSTGDTTFAEAQVITLSIASDSTATETDDYTVSSKSLTLGAGAGSVTATVKAVNDLVYEGNKTILIDATSGGSAAGTQQQITIAEDEPEPELSIASVTVDEGEPVAFVVSLEPASGKPVTVSYETADGTAKAGEDYTAVSAATLTFTAGETAKTVSVATAEDTRNEDQEEFTVTLSEQTNATLGTASATGTIADDDGEPGLRIAGATVSEGEAVAFVVSLEPASGKLVTVSYETADGTAKAGEDYTAVSAATLTFTAGETAKTVSVATAEDTRNEDQEEFTVTLSGQTNATLGTASATGTIADDDGEPGLRIAGATVSEGEPVAFVVSLEPASGKPVTVSYETADGTAKAGEDYTAVSAATLTFTAGETAKTVSVATVEDTRNEDQEEFTVTLSGQTNATLGTASATGTIADDDGEPGLRIAGATVSEGEPVAFVVSLEPASGKPVTVSYETADGTAKAGEDYTAVSAATLTFTAGETAKTVSVATAEDTRNEDQEEFTVTLSGQTNATLGTASATGTIADDDGEPGLRIAGATVSEGEPVAFVVSLEPASGKPVTVSYETADGTAKAGEDYTAVSAATLTFTAGETAKTVSVATAEDTRNEDQEEFTVTLSGQTNATLGTASATGTIADDDGEPGLRIAGATVSEGEAVAFVVSLEPASGKPVTVSYETADGTAKAGEDYTAVSAATLTFTAGETAKTVSVATAEDTRNEDQEEFTVTLSGQTNATLGTASATGTIADDDGEPGLRIAGATVSEGEAVAFVVSLEPASGKPVTVSYETADGTAKAGEDYTAVSAATLTFTAGETAKTVSVATAEDTRNEDQEEFTVTLSGQTNATLGTASATGTIADDDGEPGLRIAGATVSEGEPVAFVVSLEPASGKPVTVSYETADGTAKAGEDYTAVSAATLTFTAGETAKTVSVATAEDTRNEDQEEFTVTLSGQTNATLGTASATGTIADDDGEPGLRIAGATVSEGEPVAFVVSLEPASGKPVTVSYETADGTAKAGEDYTAVSAATLTFTAGETAKTVSVATAEDTRNEDQEEFTVTLSGQTNATLGTASATGTIADDDGEPGLRIAGATVNEGEPVAFVVSLEPASGKLVTVSYETADGTAKAGEDYTAVSAATLTFTAGETAKTVSVATVEDTRNEDQEEFTVMLSGQTNATLGTASATGTIADDDGEPELRIAGATVNEGDPARSW